jgi:hypothetical protein
MSTKRYFGFMLGGFLILLVRVPLYAQTPQWNANVNGESFLAPNGGNPAAPFNVTIGDAPTTTATLSVRGDQLPVADPFFGAPRLCTFRTDVAAVREQSWWMFRDANHIGRIWHDAGHRAFHFQSMEPVDVGLDRYSGAMVQNHQNDGLWVSQNGVPEGIRTFPNALQVLNRDGYVALGASEGWLAAPSTTDVRGPWTRLHLFDQAVGTRPYFGWRSQMRNGTLLTGNSDLAYIGHWYDQGSSGSGTPVDDRSNVVVGVAENALPAGLEHHWDNISFRFFGDLDQNDGPASTLNGLEMMRIRPYRAQPEDPVKGFVGIGDFLSAGTGPEESVDILDGRLRIRELALSPPANTLDKYMVIDNAGVVNWRDLPPAATTCEWTRNTSGKIVSSGHLLPNTNGSCPDQAWKYGVGTGSPTYKFQIEGDRATSGSHGGLLVRFRGLDTGWSYGSYAHLLPSQTSLEYAIANYGLLEGVRTEGYAVIGRSIMNVAGVTASRVFGVNGDVYVDVGSTATAHGLNGYSITRGTGTVNHNYGAKGEAGGVAGSVNYCYGMYGRATMANSANYSVFGANPGSGANDWSGYFPGKTLVGGTTFTPSDENLKTDIQPLTGATGRLMQFRPKSFRTSEFPQLGLSEGLRYGFIVQDVEQLFPQWTTTVHHPEQLDTLGNVVTPAVEFMAYTTDEIPALLVGGFQEHHQALVAQAEETAELRTMVRDLYTEVTELRQQVAGCCTNPDRSLHQPAPAGGPAVQPMDDATGDDKLRIIPNPFSEPPTVHYTLERGGRAQLMVHGSDGRGLRVLHEAAMEPGSYQLLWDTNALAPGMYYVTLLLDGQPMVEKAVKVAR